MEKEIITRTPPPKAPEGSPAPVRTMSMEKAKVLIRKVSKDHEGLFRRLAQ